MLNQITPTHRRKHPAKATHIRSTLSEQRFRGTDAAKTADSDMNSKKDNTDLKKNLKEFLIEAITTLGMVFSEILTVIIFPIYLWRKFSKK